MRKFQIVTPESLIKMAQCFSNLDESTEFMMAMDSLISDLHFCIETRKRANGNDSVNMLIKQICTFTLFCRMNMEIIQQFVRAIDLQEVTQEEMDRMMDGS